MKINILSYNIHKGFDWRNKNYFLKEVKEFISYSKADVVCLQEVVGKNNEYKKKGLIDSQFEYLADELWPHFSYAKNAVYDHGHHGNLILSKFPIESYENVDLSTNSFEKRGLLIAKIMLPQGSSHGDFFYLGCSHLNLFHAGRLVQYQKIKEQIELRNHHQTPIIIAGDFNDWNKKSAHVFEDDLQMLEVHKSTHGVFAKTFPAVRPFLCLDRIYVKNLKINGVKIFEPKQSSTVLEHLSDHLAIFCEVEFYGP